jgi:hypothetical protein
LKFVDFDDLEVHAPHRRALVLGIVLVAVAFLLALSTSPTRAFFSADFEQRYFADPDLLISDHTVIRDEDGIFHLYYTVGIVGQGWPSPGNMVDFGHATSTDLIHWTSAPRLLNAIPGTWKDRCIWAPHVMPLPQGGVAMYYCGVDSAVVQATGVAYSADLDNWTDLSIQASAYHPDPSWAVWQLGSWANGRDPFTFRLGEGVALITTALANAEYTGVGERGALSLAYSEDGVDFVDTGYPMFVNDSFRVLESPSLYRRPDEYFLFFHESGLSGIRYMTSPGLLNGWDKTQVRILDPVAFAPSELISTGNGTIMGRVYDSDFSGTILYGAKFDTLVFASQTAHFRNPNTLWDDWIDMGGNAFTFQPVYGDRPLARGGSPSGVEDFFWINTAETYTGPIHNNNPAAPPQVDRTGVLRSRPFTITGGHMRFMIAGGIDPLRLYVALKDANTGALYHHTTGSGSNVMSERFWDLNGLQGVECYIEIADNRSSGADGYIAIDGIREDAGQPAPSGVELVPAWAADLGAAYPSPTSGSASIPFSLGRGGHVRLAVYDVAGRLRRLILDQRVEAGAHSARWDGRDLAGQRVPAGVYFFRLETGDLSASRRLAILP